MKQQFSKIRAIRLWVIICVAAIISTACNNSASESAGNTEQSEENFTSEKQAGKWTTDLATSQELKGLHYTVENFTLLNRKKFENLKAYQEFGDLMQMHVDRITTYCQLDENTKSLLCKKLDKIKGEVETLQGDNMEKSKNAVSNINSILADIDSSFIYMNQ